MDGLGSASPPVAPTATTGEGRHPCTWPRTFWFKPLSAFGLLDLTTFISSSPELAMPSTLAPNRLSASSRRALSREARPPWVGEVTLSQELRTARSPRPHVLVGYQWSHTGLRPGRKTSHNRYIRSFVSHPHRSGLAHHGHHGSSSHEFATGRSLVNRLVSYPTPRSVVGYVDMFRSRCTCHVSLQRLMRRHPLPSTGSLGLVPPLQRYYEMLRLPAAHFAALRFLRLAIPSLRPLFVPPAPDAEPWINLELVGGISSRLARWKRQGLPSSRRNPCDHSPYSSDPGVTRQAEWTMS